MHVHPNYHKKMFTFVSQNIKMKSNNINFDDKKKWLLQKRENI